MKDTIIAYFRNNKIKIIHYAASCLIGVFCLFGLFNWLGQSSNIMLITKFISISLLTIISIAFWILFVLLVFILTTNKQFNPLKFCFYCCMLFGITGMLLAGYVTHGEAIRSMIFTDRTDTFMDYFASIQYGWKPYAKQVIYPPLINVIYAILGNFNVIGEGGRATRGTQTGLLVFGAYIFVTYSALIWALFKIKCGSIGEKLLFICTTLLSLPFIYAFERGNSIVLTLFFILVYLQFYKSDKTIYKYLALFSLAIAAAIKISPALFGILLVKDRKFKDAIVCAIIGIFVFMFPFIFTDGNILLLLKNISLTTAEFQGTFIDASGKLYLMGQGLHVNLLNTMKFLGRIFNKDFVNLATIGNIGILLFGVMGVMLDKNLEQWKSVGVISCIIIICTGFSTIYNIVYLIIPIIYFLDKSTITKKIDYIYVLLFASSFIPFVNFRVPLFKIFFNDMYPMRISTFVESLALLVLIVFLILGIYWHLFTDKNGFPLCQKKLLLGSIIFMSVGLVGYVYAYKAKQPVEAFYPSNLDIVNAGTGFVLKNGLFTGIAQDATLKIKTDKILKYGLVIHYNQKDDNISEGCFAKIFVGNSLLKIVNIGSERNGIIFITPFELQVAGISDKVKYANIKLNVSIPNGRIAFDRDVMLAINYIGPAKELSKVTINSYIDDSTAGFFKEGPTLWLGKRGTVLFNASDLRHNDLEIKGHVSPYWQVANPNIKPELMVITEKGVIKKELPLSGMFDIVIKSNEICTLANYFHDYPIITELQINGTFNTQTMGLDNEQRDKGLIIDSISPVRLLTEIRPGINANDVGKGIYAEGGGCWLTHEGSFTLDTSVFKYKGIYMACIVPQDLFRANLGKNIDLDIYINDKKIKTLHIEDKNSLEDDLLGIYLKPEELTDLEDSFKLSFVINATFNPSKMGNSINDNRELGLLIKYIGAKPFLEKVNSNAKLDYYAEGFTYDTRENVWTMGTKANIILEKEKLLSDGIRLRYEVSPLLIQANPTKELSFSVFMNGKKIKTVPILRAGNFVLDIPSEIIKTINDDSPCLYFKLMSNGTYNEKKMSIRNYDVDISLKIRNLEPISEAE